MTRNYYVWPVFADMSVVGSERVIQYWQKFNGGFPPTTPPPHLPCDQVQNTAA